MHVQPYADSRFIQLVHLPHGHHATAVRDALADAFGKLPASMRHTLTWDQGSEMAHHHLLASLFNDGIFFALPGSPWQRGTNENHNGLARQYLPKSTDLSIHSVEDLAHIADRLNHRPRKILNWRTPSEIFSAALAS